MGNVVLEIKNLNKKYGKKKVIDNLSLEVEEGQVYGFLGANGAGKTTTIKMIVGLISKDDGKIYINGLDRDKKYKEAMENVGAIVENPDLYDYLSGKDNLKLYARIHNVDESRVNQVVEMIGLKDRINDKVSKYSLGMKQRLGIGVSILHKPKLLILDEPTNGLDPEGIKDLRNLLKKMAHEEKIAVFISSHMLSQMQLMCDKVAIIDKGKIVKVGNVKDIAVSSNNIYELTVNNVNLGYDILSKLCKCEKEGELLRVEYDGAIVTLIKALLDSGVDVIGCNKKQVSLEEEFLNIIVGEK